MSQEEDVYKSESRRFEAISGDSGRFGVIRGGPAGIYQLQQCPAAVMPHAPAARHICI